MRTSGRRGSKRFKTASVLKDEEESAPPPTTTTRTTGTPKFSPTPAASEPDPDREPQNVGSKSIPNDTTPVPEPKPVKAHSRKQISKAPEVEVQPTDVLPPTATTTPTAATAAASSTKQPNGSEKGSTEEDEEDSKSSPLTETSSTSEQMASVAIFTPSADIKGTRTFEDLEMGNTESDRPTPDRSSAPPSISRPYMNGQSPESSSLSELDSDDSEAETERLNISPQKPILGNSTNPASYSTPKKSIGTSTLTSPSRSPSPLSTAGQESPKSPDREMTLGAIEQLTPEGSIAGSPVISPRKRKRNDGLDEEGGVTVGEETKDIMEISDLEDPPKKKVNVDPKSQGTDEEEEGDDEDNKNEHPKQSAPPPTNGHVSDAEEDSGVEDEDESPKPTQRSPGKNKQKLASANLSPKKLSAKVLDTDLDEDADEGRDTDAADSNHHNKDDDEADEMSRTKRQAADDLAAIEILFAQLRDKIVEERVAEIDKEIAMLYDGTHPELILMSQSIETHKREKIEKANILLGFQEQTAEVERIANRAAIWAQYNQEIRETREKCFSEANTQWWAIHRERRAADTSLSDYVYRIPKSLSTQINHRSRYNAEVSLLSGIAKHVGFPAAPTIAGASADEVRADLEAMGLVPAQIPIPAPSFLPPQHFPTSTQSQAGPSRLPQMSTFGPPSAYSPRPAKTLAPPPQLGNAFQPSPSHALNPETRHPRSPPSPVPQPLNSLHQAQKAPTPSSPRVTKASKGKAASFKASAQNFDLLTESVPKRVPIKLEQSPTISSLSFAPPPTTQSYTAQQPIDRRMQVGGAPAYRPFGK
ncbi:hypothetical protein TWF679_003108 [Orbilia oligospora]|uniref:Uncharacterized protein n=1 Tax=Orbilia oligospora TaxID=2813651 RepID=A0A8H8US90_ORBOL|nr:hypothetical protein TWF679_003108 [Orbilia oligospora]